MPRSCARLVSLGCRLFSSSAAALHSPVNKSTHQRGPPTNSLDLALFSSRFIGFSPFGNDVSGRLQIAKFCSARIRKLNDDTPASLTLVVFAHVILLGALLLSQASGQGSASPNTPRVIEGLKIAILA